MKGGMMMYLCSEIICNLPKSKASRVVIYPSRYQTYITSKFTDSGEKEEGDQKKTDDQEKKEKARAKKEKARAKRYVASYICI